MPAPLRNAGHGRTPARALTAAEARETAEGARSVAATLLVAMVLATFSWACISMSIKTYT